LTDAEKELRMRVFAGPNGSGKSTIIQAVREYTERGQHIEFGTYINADDIANVLKSQTLSFNEYEVATSSEEFKDIATKSGLINGDFSADDFFASYEFQNNGLISSGKNVERLAQLTADFLRKKLLTGRKKFSFETVFSHESKLDIMVQAKNAGYKVYLYFVATESPEINKERVMLRVAKKGHDVPPDKIESRYYRSLDLLYTAAQTAYQVYFFDNSNQAPRLVQHFKLFDGKKEWDDLPISELPQWFIKYYSEKIPQ
jgi:predicted ABC-type ATPase